MKRILYFFVSLCLLASCKKEDVANGSAGGETLAIQGFLPASGGRLSEVTISGTKFGSATSSNLIIMGGYNITPTAASENQLVFKVPVDIPFGSYTISVKVNGKVVNSSAKFEVTENGSGGIVSTAVVPVNADIVNTSFVNYGRGNVHPRLLYSASDIARIKSLALTDNFAKSTYDEIISKANALLGTSLLAYGLDGAGLRIQNIHEFANEQAPYLVLAYQFTKETKYAERCWRQVDLMCSYPDWGANRHFLDAGIAAKAMAMIYDGLYDYLTPQQRSKIVSATRQFVLNPGKTMIDNNSGSFKWYLSNDNWNGICHGGMIMAALAMFETDPNFMSGLVAVSANGMVKYLDSFDPDGASEEGMSYWSYGLSNTFLALESMKRVLSSTYGLAERDGFKKTGWFPYYMSGPVGTASIGDDYIYSGKTNKFLSYFWFANYFRDANMAKTHYQACLDKANKMNGWSDLLFYDPQLVSSGSAVSFPLFGDLKGVDYMYIRENGTENSMYVGMHGGDNNASHGHLDAGSFFIQAQGETFALGNLGAENPYPADYFTTTNPAYNAAPTNTALNPGRFYYYRVKTESKNCLVFNPDARPEQNPTGVAVISRKANDVTGGYYVINLTGNYNRDVSSYNRGIKLNRQNGVVTIQDEFVPKMASTVYWLMQSPATDNIQISADGKTATMTNKGKVLHAVIKSPSNASFSVVPRSETGINYLPETAAIFNTLMAGKNSINKYYGKLQIKLTNVSAATTIRVDFVRSAGTTTPALTSLNSWTTSN